MIDVISIDEWELRPEQNPQKGNREKSLFINPSNSQKYFFKNPVPKYSVTEPHSEIIASEIGNQLDIEVVQHNFGFFKGQFGSLCKTVLKTTHESGVDNIKTIRTNEELIHGQQLLLAHEPDFDIKKGRAHSFQLIKKTLESTERIKADFDKFFRRIVQMIIFDSIIGNKDRHQENWALIERPVLIAVRDSVTNNLVLKRKRIYRFSPLYDNGSSLGRELLERKVALLLNSKDRVPFESYIDRQQYHIRWFDKEIRLHDLIKNIKLEHEQIVQTVIDSAVNNFNPDRFSRWIDNYDQKLRNFKEEFCLSDNRKNLIKKLVERRIEKIKELR